MRARTTSARVAEISVSATSEAQVRRVAAEAMARPKRTAWPTLPRSTWARSVTSSRRMTGAGRAPRTARAMIVQGRRGVGLICAEDAPCGGAWASGGAAWLAAQYSIAYCRHIAASLTPPFAPRYTQSHEETMPQNNHHSGSKKQWLDDTYARSVERVPERDYPFEASDGHAVDPVYGPSDQEGWDFLEKLGFPGEYPYTRGVQPTMYRGRLWTMRQYAGFGDAEESNRRYRYLLEQGQTGLSVAFDLPTQIGYDSDHPMALAEVGKVGVAISSLADMELLFKEIPLEKVTTSMTINATAAILLAFYVAMAKKQGADLTKIGGTTQHDILKEYIARGTYIFPPEGSMRLITDVFAWCKDNLPQWNTISISGYHMREAGCTAAQELAFTFANAIAYCQAALDAGLQFDEFAPRLSFFFASYSDLLEEVAKFRAARRMWARIASERFGAKDPRSMTLRFHTQTGGATLTAQQPENNIVRTTFQALAAVLGGTQSLHTNAKDEALAPPP